MWSWTDVIINEINWALLGPEGVNEGGHIKHGHGMNIYRILARFLHTLHQYRWGFARKTLIG